MAVDTILYQDLETLAKRTVSIDLPPDVAGGAFSLKLVN